jgi:hypothetical protein
MHPCVQIEHLVPASRDVTVTGVQQDRALCVRQWTQKMGCVGLTGSGHLWVIVWTTVDHLKWPLDPQKKLMESRA